MAVKVCLDAGHYGKYNRSPAVSSYYESDIAHRFYQDHYFFPHIFIKFLN